MKRNATLNLKGLDPDVLDAARDVARRAGIPLETWIASVVEPEDRPQPKRKRRPVALDESPMSERPSASILVPPHAEARPAAGFPAAEHPAVPPASAPKPEPFEEFEPAMIAPPEGRSDPFAASVAQMLARLDAIDETGNSARTVTPSSTGYTEASPATGSVPAADEMSERLATIERRMIELSEQLAQPRPLGRRGRPVAVEVADAVGEIRQRQRELDERQAAPGAVAAMQQNLAAGMAAAFPPAPSSSISELQIETSRLRDCIGGLATGQDVNALEQAMLSLANGIQQVQKPDDLADIVEPIARIQIQVSRLAEDVAENVHARVAGDVERLAIKFEQALSSGSPGNADRNALGGLFAQIEEIRRLVAALAGPERIQSLANGLQALSAQIATLQGEAAHGATRMAELQPLLEEIRTDLRTPKTSGIEQQIQAMGRKLDALGGTYADGSGSEAIIDRIDALSEKVDRVGVNPVGDLIGRLEDLGESLRRPALPGGDLATIHAMLHDLVDKVDRVGAGGSSTEGLDALEKQIFALSQRMETRGTDPAIAGLERSMSDLLAQVGSPVAKGVARDEIGSLRAGLADLRTQQAASEQRMLSTLNGVHAALDRLSTHFGGSAPTTPPPQGRAAAQPDAITGAVRANAAARRPEMPKASAAVSETPAEWSRAKDEIIEPGAGRPNRSRLGATPDQVEPEATALSTGEIKSNFIAAARRAALAAQAEADETSPKSRMRDGQRAATEDAPAGADGEPKSTRSAALRAAIDKRRKSLLLGLAAVVLALGTYQGIRILTSAEDPMGDDRPVAALDGATKSPSSAAAAAPSAGETIAASESEKPATELVAPLDPQTTQSIAKAPQPAPTSNAAPAAAVDPAQGGVKPAQPTGRKAVPRVAEMGAFAGDLAGLPTALATLKKAALEGDGTAIYDLASRAAEGRGLTRDLAVAAKLFETLASAGYAPAQYKLAGQYEKGLGLTRDLAQAKLWYGRAADQGNVRSMHNLAVIFAENPSATGKPDFTTAAQWFRRGAEHGVRDSQYNLAVLYARGLGVPQDLMQSYAWFAAAAAQGDDDAAKKRDDVAEKLAAKDLSAARSLAATFKAKVPDPAANEPPAAAGSAAMTLLGAPTPAVAPTPRRI